MIEVLFYSFRQFFLYFDCYLLKQRTEKHKLFCTKKSMKIEIENEMLRMESNLLGKIKSNKKVYSAP